jgi:flavin reductase (DIM6/NTAB) family NADH-FMN oxidoreductase RutF
MADGCLDTRALRSALGLFTTGVTVITTRRPDGSHTGLTVNSFTSVSLEPPLVLFCLASRSTLVPAFRQAQHFAVNVLAKGQQALSNMFAKPSLNMWEGVQYRIGVHGCALIAGALGTFECARREAVPGGDHLIVVGEVVCFEAVEPRAEPLVFCQGTYGTFTRDQSGIVAVPDGTLSEFVSYWG